MKIIPAIIAAAVASAVGAVVWVLIRNFTGYELGLVAWGIGVLAGVGAAAATAGKSDGATGFVAGCVAVLAIAGAKYAFATMVYSDVMSEFDDEGMIAWHADDVVMERDAAGERIIWPAGYTYETAFEEEHYPADIWQEGESRWNALPRAERKQMKQDVALEAVNYALTMENEDRLDEFTPIAILKSDLSPFDALWVVLAFASAVKIGSGVVGES